MSDEKKRQQYDQFGEEGLNGEGFRTGSFNFDDIFKDFGFGGFGGKNNGNKRGSGNGFKFSFGGFDDFFQMDDDDDDDDDEYMYENEDEGDSMFGGFGDFGDSFFGHHRNGDRQVYRETSSGI